MQDQGAALRRLLLILRRRWRILVLSWLLTVGATAAYTFTTTRLYRPQATIELRPEAPVVSSQNESDYLLAGAYMWENYYRTQESILVSPTILEATLKTLPEALRAEYARLPDPLRALAQQIEIEKLRTSFILRVGFIDRDPAKARDIVNTLVSVYLDDANRRLRHVKESTVAALSEETLPGIRKRVDGAENALTEFRSANGFIDLDERHRSLLDDWKKVTARLSERRLTGIRLRAELTALSNYKADAAGGLFHPSFHQTKSLDQLGQNRIRVAEELVREERTLKESHPRIRTLRQEIMSIEKEILEAVAGTLTAIQTDLRATEQEERALAQELARLEGSIAEVGGRLVEYRKLDAEVTAAKDLYGAYLKKHGDVAVTSGAGLASVRVVDPARLPKDPYKPRVTVNLALGGLLGFLVGVGLVFLTDQLDSRIRSADEIAAFAGLDVLAVIPKLLGAAKGEEGRPFLLGKESGLAGFEAFRGLRAEVVTRLGRLGGSAKVLSVLSPMQGEGKSTVTLNLAKMLAMEGRRILILDADLRRPAMKHFMDKEGPGLEEVLSGAASLEKVVRPSRIEGVDIIGAREGTSGAAELASSPRFASALREAREKYDLILIDSAPVIPAAESALVARQADAALLVVRENRTVRGALQGARKRLEGMDVRVLGAILNCAEERGGEYGYYGYYYYSHRPYYGK